MEVTHPMSEPNQPTDYTIQKFDRIRGSLDRVALFTKPSTVQNIEFLLGRAETFVVRTARWDERGGDFIFIECMDESGLTRLVLPPKVANAIASQRESLTRRRRSLAAKQRAACLTDEQKDQLRDRLAKARVAGKKKPRLAAGSRGKS